MPNIERSFTGINYPNTESLNSNQLRETVIQYLKELGWKIESDTFIPPISDSKDHMRDLHRNKRIEKGRKEKEFIFKKYSRLIEYFADGSDIVPQKFKPQLVKVEPGTESSDLFRFATLLWSVPVSSGYGRRMRYLVIDSQNNKLVGLFALGDPVFNLAVRDKKIDWNSEQRGNRLYHVMDAFVIGAVPPYNDLLCGKYVAASMLSNQIRADFKSKYKDNRTEIQGKKKKPDLVLITTTSALGRSSIYNRLKVLNENSQAFQSVGYSQGWGHFHFNDEIFGMLRNFLRTKDDKYADGYKYGQGPNWKIRVIRKALNEIGINGNVLKHGIQREVFLAPLAINYKEYLQGIDEKAKYIDRDFDEITEYFKNRWLIPRSERIDRWKLWTKEKTWEQISTYYDLNLNSDVISQPLKLDLDNEFD